MSPRTIICLAVLLTPAFAEVAIAADWPQFLGPNRNGISLEKGLINEYPAGGPTEIWRTPGGVGMSGLAISQGKLLTLIQTDREQLAICLSAKTGETNWSMPIAPAYRNGQGHGPRATPTIVGDTALFFTGDGTLAALELDSGESIWSHNVMKEHGAKPAEYGMACSPLVVSEQVVVTAGLPKATLLAYDLKSGELAWTAGKSDTAGYSSPALLTVGGREQIVAFTGSSAIGVSPKRGELLWRHAYKTDYNCNIATPLAIDGQVFLSAGESHGSVLLRLVADGDRFQTEEVWSSQGTGSVLRNEWQTSILLDGYLYGFDNVGSAGPVTHLTCVNATTGERAWQKTRFGKGNLIAADGKLFITTMKGELVLVAASAKSYRELGRANVLGTTRQAPALANGMLYLRDGNEIVCLNVKKQ